MYLSEYKVYMCIMFIHVWLFVFTAALLYYSLKRISRSKYTFMIKT